MTSMEREGAGRGRIRWETTAWGRARGWGRTSAPLGLRRGAGAALGPAARATEAQDRCIRRTWESAGPGAQCLGLHTRLGQLSLRLDLELRTVRRACVCARRFVQLRPLPFGPQPSFASGPSGHCRRTEASRPIRYCTSPCGTTSLGPAPASPVSARACLARMHVLCLARLQILASVRAGLHACPRGPALRLVPHLA
jgi:hypothetical protein